MAEAIPQVEQDSEATSERTCPDCNAGNPLTAEFCWQCFARLQVPAGPMGSQAWSRRPGFPGADMPPTSFPAPPQPTGGSTLRRLGVALLSAVVAAAAGWFVVDQFGGATPTLPETLAGSPRFESAEVTQALEVFHAGMESQGIEGDMAFYGTGAPQSLLAWFHDPSKTDPDFAFSEFSTGFGLGGGSGIGEPSKDTLDGTEYLCAPISGVIPGGVCMWQDDEIYWFVFNFQPGLGLSSTQDLAVQAHQALEAA